MLLLSLWIGPVGPLKDLIITSVVDWVIRVPPSREEEGLMQLETTPCVFQRSFFIRFSLLLSWLVTLGLKKKKKTGLNGGIMSWKKEKKRKKNLVDREQSNFYLMPTGNVRRIYSNE